jgi:IS30 family transposase
VAISGDLEKQQHQREQRKNRTTPFLDKGNNSGDSTKQQHHRKQTVALQQNNNSITITVAIWQNNNTIEDKEKTGHYHLLTIKVLTKQKPPQRQ